MCMYVYVCVCTVRHGTVCNVYAMHGCMFMAYTVCTHVCNEMYVCIMNCNVVNCIYVVNERSEVYAMKCIYVM